VRLGTTSVPEPASTLLFGAALAALLARRGATRRKVVVPPPRMYRNGADAGAGSGHGGS